MPFAMLMFSNASKRSTIPQLHFFDRRGILAAALLVLLSSLMLSKELGARSRGKTCSGLMSLFFGVSFVAMFSSIHPPTKFFCKAL